MGTDLVTSGIQQRTLTFLALGGSGVRSIEPLLYLCAFGLGPRRLRLVLIDPDQSNAAVKRSRELIETYRETRRALAEQGAADVYFRTEVIDGAGSSLVWSPITDDEGLADARFSTRVDRTLMRGRGAALGHLFDLLNPERIRGMDLTMGFRGVPSIGTVFMNRLRDESFFAQMLSQSQAEADGVFFAVGSIFGGTGSAAFPVIGRALADGIKARDGGTDIAGVPPQRIGGALYLPYFTLPAPETRDAPDGGPRPETVLFAQNAAGALPTYLTTSTGYGALYMVGDSVPREQLRNEVGGEKQANDAHYVELFGALAALDFTARGGEEPSARLPVVRATAVDGRDPGWADLPLDEASRGRLVGGMVAAHTFLTAFRPDGRAHPDLSGVLRGVTWAGLLKLTPEELAARTRALDGMARVFGSAWAWLAELRRSTPALALVPASNGRPTEVRPDELIEGRAAAGRERRARHTAPVVFRYWNEAAYAHRGRGFPGFMEVMREGSERYARAAFAENVTLKGAA
ncbi:MAG TPA: hypothetical protein VF665_16945 [Longimicrobium sp.]|jgi:hypothetical protein|uniref:hypothetical protein n=1 Tax=Longimicrobium sp. TaxID=2029185 RepID=UPI002ED847F7